MLFPAKVTDVSKMIWHSEENSQILISCCLCFWSNRCITCIDWCFVLFTLNAYDLTANIVFFAAFVIVYLQTAFSILCVSYV